MGYTTKFTGHFNTTPALTASQIARLNKFAEDRHENYAAEGKPGYYCQWVPNAEGTQIEWDEGEKFYGYFSWITYMIGFFFAPWGVQLNGTVEWEGDERDDHGKIIITNNVARIEESKMGHSRGVTAQAIPKVPLSSTMLAKSLGDASEDELRAVLRRIEMKKHTPPPMIKHPNFAPLVAAAREHAENIAKKGWRSGTPPKDSEHFMFESVMIAVYGPNYFKWEREFTHDHSTR